MMNKFHLDAIVAPTAGPAWINDWATGDHAVGGSSNAAAVAGYPNISVPAGFIFGLPVGISFFGRAWSEPVLLKIAYGFEQTLKARKPPQFLGACHSNLEGGNLQPRSPPRFGRRLDKCFSRTQEQLTATRCLRRQ